MTTSTISISAVNGTYEKPVPVSGEKVVLNVSRQTVGTTTAGTLTFRAKSPNARDYSTIVGTNTIDLSAPERLEIDGNASFLEITLTGFSGTATEIKLEQGKE